MAFSETQAERIRAVLPSDNEIEERRMFGGLSFLSAGRMVCGLVGDDLVVRVGPDRYEEVLGRPHTRPMDFTGRPLRGWVYVSPRGYADDHSLEEWVAMGLEHARQQPPKKQ